MGLWWPPWPGRCRSGCFYCLLGASEGDHEWDGKRTENYAFPRKAEFVVCFCSNACRLSLREIVLMSVE